MTYLLEHKADIIKYLPFFMQEYLEMQEITKTEDIEFNFLIESLIKMLDNQFITIYCRCTVYFIALYIDNFFNKKLYFCTN